MTKYRIHTDVVSARGHQTWIADCNSPEEALVLHEKGESVFEDQELEVTDLTRPTLDDVEPVEGDSP